MESPGLDGGPPAGEAVRIFIVQDAARCDDPAVRGILGLQPGGSSSLYTPKPISGPAILRAGRDRAVNATEAIFEDAVSPVVAPLLMLTDALPLANTPPFEPAFGGEDKQWTGRGHG
jgi:hypothetical protein